MLQVQSKLPGTSVQFALSWQLSVSSRHSLISEGEVRKHFIQGIKYLVIGVCRRLMPQTVKFLDRAGRGGGGGGGGGGGALRIGASSSQFGPK